MMWSSLSVDIHVLICRCLLVKERATFALVSRDMCRVSRTAFSYYPHITDGKLPEVLGREFDMIVDLFRYCVIDLCVATNLSHQAERLVRAPNDINLLRTHGLMKDLQQLNMDMYTFWDQDYTGGSGVFNYGKLTADSNPDIPCMKKVAGLQGWKQDRIYDEFFVLMQRPDGAVLISADFLRVYLVLGISQALTVPMLACGGPGFELPLLANLTILPYEGYLVYDGLGASSLKKRMTASLKRKLYQVYEEAINNNTIIYTKQNTPPTLLHNPSSGPAYDAMLLTPSQLHFQGVLKNMKKIKGYAGVWTFRRFDYTEETNPDHVLAVLGNGPIAMRCKMSSLHPTVDDILMILKDIVVDGKGVIQRGKAPHTIAIDELSILAFLSGYMQICGIVTCYYPPPSEEETTLRTYVGCATCGRPEWPGKPLLLCSRCRAVKYCDSRCQKAHWNVHKGVCKKS